MLIDLFPRAHARYASLPLLGPQMDGFAHWLADKGLSTLSIRNRILRAPRLEEILSDRSVHCLGELSQTELLEFGAVPAADDSRQSALVRSLANYLDERVALARPVPPPSARLADTFRDYLGQVRGLADATAKRQRDTALALLEFLEFDHMGVCT